jgi:hypothetical protein
MWKIIVTAAAVSALSAVAIFTYLDSRHVRVDLDTPSQLETTGATSVITQSPSELQQPEPEPAATDDDTADAAPSL